MKDNDNEPRAISINEILSALTSKRRRYILYYLREEETATVDDIARQLTAWEESKSPERASDDELERRQMELYHNHLPKLADANLIDFDDRSETARYNYPPTVLTKVLDLLARIELTNGL